MAPQRKNAYDSRIKNIFFGAEPSHLSFPLESKALGGSQNPEDFELLKEMGKAFELPSQAPEARILGR